MAIKIDIEDTNGQIFGYWFVEQYIQNIRAQKLDVTVIGYKNKAARDNGKTGIQKQFTIEGAAWQKNMTIAEIEAAVMASPQFVGGITTA